MKLNKEGRIQLRKNIEEQLKNVPEGVKIHLDKDILEQLLFETSTVHLNGNSVFPYELDGKEVSLKHLIWSGSFLSKIDLSEVSFDGVFWNLDYDATEYFDNKSKNLYKQFGVKIIDLSNTNAKIDISKAFGSDIEGVEIELSHCNFSNTNLSNNVIDYHLSAENCNFSNTGLGVNFNSKGHIRFYSSILSGLDLSEYTVDETFFGEEYQQYQAFNCDLSNTGLGVKTTKIPDDILSKHKIWLGLRRDLNSDKISSNEQAQVSIQMSKLFKETYEYKESLDGMDFLGETIAKGYLVGCYVNDKKIMPKDENHTISKEKLLEYETYQQELFSSVNSTIQEQIRSLKK